MASSTQPPNGTSTGSPRQRDTSEQARLGQDGIQRVKDMARATMSATLQPGATSNPPSRTASRSPSQLRAGQTNEASPGRKRSRSGSRIESLPNELERNRSHLVLEQYKSRDKIHAEALQADQQRMKELGTSMSHDLRLWDELRRRSQLDVSRRPTQPLYPAQRRRPASRRTAALHVSRADRNSHAEQLEDLVPIRIDLEHEKLRLRDTFTWNVHDRVVPPEIFAQGLVEDFKIPPEAQDHFTREVYTALQDQITDFHPHPSLPQDSLDPHLPYSAYKNDEMRIPIKLNITIGPHTLVDQFDWDINTPANSAETFAARMSADLALTGEFTTAIAHCIREQTQQFTKALYISAHQFDGRAVEDAEVRESLLPSPLTSAYRPYQAAKDYAPYFYELNAADLERTELAFSREQRQQKRSTLNLNRRGGPSLPDLKEKLKTWRTQIVSGVIPGAAPDVTKSGIYRLSRARRRPWNAGMSGGIKAGDGGADDDDLMLSADSGDGSATEHGTIDSPAMRNAAHPGSSSAAYLMGGAGTGTSRTRGMRGAAAVAQAAMRANLARSISPDSTFVETKGMSRRLGAGPIFESIDEVTGNREGLTVKLKVPRERFRVWWREWKRLLPQREAEMMAQRARMHQHSQMQMQQHQAQQIQMQQQQQQAQHQQREIEQMRMRDQQQQQQAHLAQMRSGGLPPHHGYPQGQGQGMGPPPGPPSAGLGMPPGTPGTPGSGYSMGHGPSMAQQMQQRGGYGGGGPGGAFGGSGGQGSPTPPPPPPLGLG